MYNWKTREIHELNNSISEFDFELDNFSDIFVLLCPVINGIAFIGSPEKYLSPATYEFVSIGKREISIKLNETDSILIWAKHSEIASDSASNNLIAQNLYQLRLYSRESNIIKIKF